MTPLRTRLIRAVVIALMVLALSGSVATAHEGGGSGFDCVPYDPGLPADQLPWFPESWR